MTTKTLLEVSDLTVFNDRGMSSVKNVSFSINSGEILGIAGVEGNGQKELAEALALIRPFQNGVIRINGKIVNEKDTGSQWIGHVPDDRQENGLVLELTVSRNMILGREREVQFSSFNIKENSVKKFARELIKEYNISPQNSELITQYLSGGNQQKVVLSRELSKNAEFIIMNQPTRGLDVSASEFIYRSVLKQKEKGNAILLISSDLSELLKLSDRIGVMYEGKIAAIFDAKQTNEHELGLYMTCGN